MPFNNFLRLLGLEKHIPVTLLFKANKALLLAESVLVASINW